VVAQEFIPGHNSLGQLSFSIQAVPALSSICAPVTGPVAPPPVLDAAAREHFVAHGWVELRNCVPEVVRTAWIEQAVAGIRSAPSDLVKECGPGDPRSLSDKGPKGSVAYFFLLSRKNSQK